MLERVACCCCGQLLTLQEQALRMYLDVVPNKVAHFFCILAKRHREFMVICQKGDPPFDQQSDPTRCFLCQGYVSKPPAKVSVTLARFVDGQSQVMTIGEYRCHDVCLVGQAPRSPSDTKTMPIRKREAA